MVETGKDLEFFKVFLPKFSSHELVIPPAFIDILEKPLPKEALLLDEIGQLWRVETKTEDTEERVCVLFKKGWEIFAKDHSLEFGDFLVFSYDGDSRFSVTIFSQDGCKKDLGGVTSTDISRVSFEKEPVGWFTKPECRNNRGNWVKRKRQCDSAKKDPTVIVNDDEPEYASTIKTEPEYQEITQTKFNRGGDSYDISWVPENRDKGFEEPVYKPKHPHFVRTINHASLHRLDIPTRLLKSNGIDLEGDIELCDENGKKLSFKVVKNDRGIGLSREEWVYFCKNHKLIKNNKCLFEFIVTSNGRCNEIQVRIFRGNLATTITRNGYQVLAM